MDDDVSALLAYPAVQAALADIRMQHGVHIPLAVESGSRAWGFPSPDSDYDARFVYVRPAAQHLTPWPACPVSPIIPAEAGTQV